MGSSLPKGKLIDNEGNVRDKRRVESLTLKERRFIAAKLRGESNIDAYFSAGYRASDGQKTPARAIASANAHGIMKRARVVEAIQEALEAEEATPEFAVKQIVQAAVQTKDWKTKLKASETILKLHGYKEAEKPTVTLEFGSSFFGKARKVRVVEGEVVGDADDGVQRDETDNG